MSRAERALSSFLTLLLLAPATWAAEPITVPQVGPALPICRPEPRTRSKGPSYVGFTLGFSLRGDDKSWEQMPLFGPYDSTIQAWWDDVVDQAIHAGVHFVAPVTRGCNPCGANDVSAACPRDLSRLVSALRRRPDAKLKVALFVDTGGAFAIQKNLCKHRRYSVTPPLDLSDAEGRGEGGWHYLVEHDIIPFFETVPKDLLFQVEGKPVVYFWSMVEPLGYVNHEGNLKRLLARVREAVREKAGAEPFLVLDQSWPQLDTTIEPKDAEGVNDWFAPPSACSVRSWNGRTFGVSVPGFNDPPSSPFQRKIPREGGKTLETCLLGFAARGAFLTLLEGLTDVEESAGYYRSLHADWSYPDQYLDIVRAFVQRTEASSTNRPCRD